MLRSAIELVKTASGNVAVCYQSQTRTEHITNAGQFKVVVNGLYILAIRTRDYLPPFNFYITNVDSISCVLHRRGF